jgi:hypothetical protein
MHVPGAVTLMEAAAAAVTAVTVSMAALAIAVSAVAVAVATVSAAIPTRSAVRAGLAMPAAARSTRGLVGNAHDSNVFKVISRKAGSRRQQSADGQDRPQHRSIEFHVDIPVG